MGSIEFPRQVDLKSAGIYYEELGPNKAWINLIEQINRKERTKKEILTLNIDQTEAGNAFTAMAQGYVIASLSIFDSFVQMDRLLKEGR